LKQENQHKNHDGAGVGRKLPNLIAAPLISPEPLDLGRVRTVNDLVRAMAKTAFTGHQIGEAANVLEEMARDKDCFVVMTLGGETSVAGQGLVIAELIDRGIVHAVVSTGAIVAHGLVEVVASSHDHRKSGVPGEVFYQEDYNQEDYNGHDRAERGHTPDDVQEAMSRILETWDHNEIVCSYKLNHLIGQQLAKHGQRRGILKSAYEKGVPVFIPAFTDSGLGLDFALHNRMRESTGRHKMRYDPFEDLEHFTATLLRQKRLGLFSIGEDVPSNWSQQFGPFIELRHRRLGENVSLKRYHYSVRICTEPVHVGGLAGSPDDAVSRRRFVPPAEGGKFGEVFLDATVGLPLIVAAVLERLGNGANSRAKNKKEKAAFNDR
jgi:deoxyhypusine synthase